VKPLLIGEAPSKNEDPYAIVPLGGRVGRRLAACAGLPFCEFLERFDRINLLEVRQDTKEKGFEFDLPAARIKAAALWDEWHAGPPRTVIFLGRRVARSFGFGSMTLFSPVTLGTQIAMYQMPHPSGVNRWWNDAENCTLACAFMHKIVEEHR